MLLGKISGSVTTKGFDFIAEARIKKNQYVAVKNFEGKWILAYVHTIIKYSSRTVGKAKVIGYRDSRGFLRPLTIPFEPGTPVFTADEDLIKRTLGLKDDGLYVGLLSGYHIKVALPTKHIVTKHVAILAKTGTGKSYVAGVMLEELAEKKIPVVVIDPHGEYSSLVRENKRENEVRLMNVFGIEPKSYKKQVQIYDMSNLKLNTKLTTDEILDMLPAKISSTQRGLLYAAIKNLEGHDYTLRDIIEEVGSFETQTKWNLISLLEILERTHLFSANPTKPQELVKKGKITIVDLKEAQPEIQQMVVMKIVKDLFYARKLGKIPEFFLVLEEAHNFCPERGFGEVSSSKILRTIASEGRKFGLGLCVISQRPAKVDKNVLSQCSTQIILKVTNPNDVKAIMDSVEGIGFGAKEDIKDLPIGTAMVVGVTEQPLFVDIRVRRSEHGGESVKIDKKKEVAEPDVLAFATRFSEDDIKKEFKGIEEIRFINYPVWKVRGTLKNEEIEFYVDGVTGELIYEKNGNMKYSRGLRTLLELSPSQRAIVLYLIKHRFSSPDKISNDLKMLLSNVDANLKVLIKNGMVSSDGHIFRSNFNIDIPDNPEELKIKYELVNKERDGEFLEFMVSTDYVRKIGEVFSIKIDEIVSVYLPYWLISHKNSKYLINALNNRLELEKSKMISQLVGDVK
ncbi:MAG: ATP-binding protein [Candidatus Aenigmarchaeota archaeon]|nr:ATP-binding protein [Candidatus Aenigmarchaeota archaeon]